ncbi:MAG: peptidylprolyl isomerase [Parvularculaceae bacterium]
MTETPAEEGKKPPLFARMAASAGRAIARASAHALRAAGAFAWVLLKAFGKFCMTVWHLAAALDSALWRAVKLLARRAFAGGAYAARLAARSFRGLIEWLPTRMGRAYSSLFGAFLVVMGLWVADLLRTAPAIEAAGSSLLRAPVDAEDPILARIEGRYVHLSEIEASARAGGFLRPEETLTPVTAFERGLVESYVEQRLLARAALSEGMQRSPAVARRVNAARDRVLAAAYMDAQVEVAVTPENVRRLYAAQADVTRIGDEVRARHIVVPTKEEADAIVAELAAGADFSALARQKSIDRATAPLGGEVGWFNRSQMTPDFSKAAFSAEKGAVAPPFHTEFGWHVLEVLDKRSGGTIPFAQVKGRIEDFLRMRTIDSALKTLEEESQVVYFRPETDAPVSTPPAPDLLDRPLDESGFVLPDATEPEGGAGDAPAEGLLR